MCSSKHIHLAIYESRKKTDQRRQRRTKERERKWIQITEIQNTSFVSFFSGDNQFRSFWTFDLIFCFFFRFFFNFIFCSSFGTHIHAAHSAYRIHSYRAHTSINTILTWLWLHMSVVSRTWRIKWNEKYRVERRKKYTIFLLLLFDFFATLRLCVLVQVFVSSSPLLPSYIFIVVVVVVGSLSCLLGIYLSAMVCMWMRVRVFARLCMCLVQSYNSLSFT